MAGTAAIIGAVVVAIAVAVAVAVVAGVVVAMLLFCIFFVANVACYGPSPRPTATVSAVFAVFPLQISVVGGSGGGAVVGVVVVVGAVAGGGVRRGGLLEPLERATVRASYRVVGSVFENKRRRRKA